MPHQKVDLLPLNLTVHSTPSMQSLSQGVQAVETQRKGRWKMFVVLLVCAAPVIASYFTYYVIRPDGRRNFGELIEPQKDMPALMAKTLEGQEVPLSQLKGQWLLVSTSGAACQAQCETHLYLQRQLREGLGREKERLDWVWLVTDGQQPTAELKKALQPAAQVLQIDATALQTWLQPAAGQQLSDHLYVIDPLGHWMLRFPANLDKTSAPKAKRDLERLLRASSSWDQPGR